MALKIQKFFASRKVNCVKQGAGQLEAQLSMLTEPNHPNPFQVITDSFINEATDDKATTLNKDSDIDIEI